MSKPSTHIYTLPDTDLVLDGEDKKYVLRVRDLPLVDKPREKLLRLGPDTLSVQELLAIVLGVGTKREEVMHMASRLLKEYGERVLPTERNPKRLSEALDVPLAKACQIVAAFELGRRFFKISGQGKPESLRTARQVFEYVRDIRELPKEHLRGLYLNSHFRLVRDEIVSIGSVTANIIHPREVFRPALEYSASALILVHNHPSGIATPSEADIMVTGQIVAAGKILGIKLLDHIIVTKTGYKSIAVDYDA